MLMDIGTEELSHLEVVGTLARMHLKPLKSDRDRAHADPLIAIAGGGGVNLFNSQGNPWTADYLKITGELDVDLRNNIAAEARAKIVYERLINFCDERRLHRCPAVPDDARDHPHEGPSTPRLSKVSAKGPSPSVAFRPPSVSSISTSTTPPAPAIAVKPTPAAPGTKAANGNSSPLPRSSNSSPNKPVLASLSPTAAANSGNPRGTEFSLSPPGRHDTPNALEAWTELSVSPNGTTTPAGTFSSRR